MANASGLLAGRKLSWKHVLLAVGVAGAVGVALLARSNALTPVVYKWTLMYSSTTAGKAYACRAGSSVRVRYDKPATNIGSYMRVWFNAASSPLHSSEYYTINLPAGAAVSKTYTFAAPRYINGKTPSHLTTYISLNGKGGAGNPINMGKLLTNITNC